MATLVLTIVTPDSVADVVSRLVIAGSSPFTITNDPFTQERVARYVEGVANGAYNSTSVVVAVS